MGARDCHQSVLPGCPRDAPSAARARFHLATGSGHRYFRDSGDQAVDLEHQRHRQRRLIFAEQFYRLRRQGLGCRDDRQVGDALQDFDRSAESILGNARRLPRDDRQYGRRQSRRVRSARGSRDLVRVAELERCLVQGDVLAGPEPLRRQQHRPSSEPDCNGGNIPGSGALPPLCNDGSFGNLYSVSLGYLARPLYLTAAYEMHTNVNRTSDLPNLDPRDVGDESAYKVGGQYVFPTKTTLSALWERTKRKIPSDLEFQNERTRNNATWLALTQVLTEKDSVSFGWGHAGKSEGVLGVHNSPD